MAGLPVGRAQPAGGRDRRLERRARHPPAHLAPALLARNGWGTRPGLERIVAVRILRSGFEALLRQAVHAAMEPEIYPSRAAWNLARRYANVCVAWHLDVDASGAELDHETLRIEIRDQALTRLAREWLVSVDDWTPWVRAQRMVANRAAPVPSVAQYPLAGADVCRLAGRRG
ncbi:MAG: DUF4291 family protein [Myxococcota bacterium]